MYDKYFLKTSKSLATSRFMKHGKKEANFDLKNCKTYSPCGIDRSAWGSVRAQIECFNGSDTIYLISERRC